MWPAPRTAPSRDAVCPILSAVSAECRRRCARGASRGRRRRRPRGGGASRRRGVAATPSDEPGRDSSWPVALSDCASGPVAWTGAVLRFETQRPRVLARFRAQPERPGLNWPGAAYPARLGVDREPAGRDRAVQVEARLGSMFDDIARDIIGLMILHAAGRVSPTGNWQVGAAAVLTMADTSLARHHSPGRDL